MATRFIPLTDIWQQVASGPAVLQARGGDCLVATGPAMPLPQDRLNCFYINNTFVYSGSEDVFARFIYDPRATDVGVVVDDGF